MPEFELAQISVKVFLGNAVVDTIQTTPEHPEEPLYRVRVYVARTYS
jgi:hypothetical protein